MQKLKLNSPGLVIFYVLGISGAVAYIDYLTPPEVPIDALYALTMWLALACFGFAGGLIAATFSVICFYVSNYYFQGSGSNGENIWAVLLLTYALYLLFTYGAYLFLLNQRKLVKAHQSLQEQFVELDRLHQETEVLHQQKLQLAVTDERNRIAREIHDVLAQGFTAIILQIEAALVDRHDAALLEERLLQINQLARYNLQEARRSVAGLRPLPLDGKSLIEALKIKAKTLTSQYKLEIEVTSDGQPRPLRAEVEAGLFRIVEEALSNVVRHAQAKHTRIALDYDEDDICLTVLDDGQGFESAGVQKQAVDIAESFGLNIMKERASLIGGWLTVQSSSSQGCRVRVIVPYNAVSREDMLKLKKATELNVAG